MTLQLEAVAFDTDDVTAIATFWAALLDRDIIEEPDGALLPGGDLQVGLRFTKSDSVQRGKPRLHLHLTSDSRDHQRHIAESAIRLGGNYLDVGQGEDAEFIVLADPGGNELCVIEPENRYLAGTGRLGEVTCDGPRAVGLFWSESLQWPLVLDQDEQSAVQAPSGGTKISWDPWPGERTPERSRRRQRFELIAADVARERDRLIRLGASMLEGSAERVEMADPGGDVFVLTSG